jgi:hypothetical protein
MLQNLVNSLIKNHKNFVLEKKRLNKHTVSNFKIYKMKNKMSKDYFTEIMNRGSRISIPKV